MHSLIWYLILHRTVINMECFIDNSGMVVYTMVWFYTHELRKRYLFLNRYNMSQYYWSTVNAVGLTKYTSMECIKYSLYQLWYKLVVPALVKHSKSSPYLVIYIWGITSLALHLCDYKLGHCTWLWRQLFQYIGFCLWTEWPCIQQLMHERWVTSGYSFMLVERQNPINISILFLR